MVKALSWEKQERKVSGNKKMTEGKKKILLIDANSFIHRAFHALPPLKTKEGKPVGAIYGLTNTLLRILENERPDYVAAAFDTPETTFRKEMFEEYKAQRPETPEELISQIVESYNLFEKLGIKTLEKPGFEADDVLGALAERFTKDKNVKTFILTGDLDSLQLVDDENTIVLVPQKGVSRMTEYNEEKVKERFGVEPSRLADYKGLVGDSSDNIPGIPGIGPKTAKSLLQKYGTIERMYEKIEKEENENLKEKIIKNKAQALLSKKLATIKKEIPLDFSLEGLKYEKGNGQLIEYLKSLSFESLVNRLDSAPKEENLL